MGPYQAKPQRFHANPGELSAPAAAPRLYRYATLPSVNHRHIRFLEPFVMMFAFLRPYRAPRPRLRTSTLRPNTPTTRRRDLRNVSVATASRYARPQFSIRPAHRCASLLLEDRCIRLQGCGPVERRKQSRKRESDLLQSLRSLTNAEKMQGGASAPLTQLPRPLPRRTNAIVWLDRPAAAGNQPVGTTQGRIKAGRSISVFDSHEAAPARYVTVTHPYL